MTTKPKIISFNHFQLIILLIPFLMAGCSGSKEFSGFSYDPEGVTNTADKEIQPQHKRTIGIASDGIWISNEFRGARMNDFYRVNDSLYKIIIKPENFPINNSPWYAFKAWADTQRTVRLKLDYAHGKHRYYPELSTDGRHWSPIDSSSYKTDTLQGTATLKLDLSQDTLWVSAQEIITGDYYNRWADSLAQKPYVRQDTVGYSHQQRPVQKLTISEAADSARRGVIIIISRLHPPEIPGNMASFAFIEEIASDSDLAKSFREHFEIIAYPFANPDGADNGHWRHNAGGVDLNRDWVNFNQPETDAIKKDLVYQINTGSPRKVFYGIDFHSTDENIFYPINRDIETFPDDFTYRWIGSLKADFPEQEFAVEPFDTRSPIAKNWIYRTFGADAVTYEVDDRAEREMLRAIARTSAKLIMRELIFEWKNSKN